MAFRASCIAASAYPAADCAVASVRWRVSAASPSRVILLLGGVGLRRFIVVARVGIRDAAATARCSAPRRCCRSRPWTRCPSSSCSGLRIVDRSLCARCWVWPPIQPYGHQEAHAHFRIHFASPCQSFLLATLRFTMRCPHSTDIQSDALTARNGRQ